VSASIIARGLPGEATLRLTDRTFASSCLLEIRSSTSTELARRRLSGVTKSSTSTVRASDPPTPDDSPGVEFPAAVAVGVSVVVGVRVGVIVNVDVAVGVSVNVKV
jgi:hypothetical protein